MIDSAFNLNKKILKKSKNEENLESVLFSRGYKTSKFFTEDSFLYYKRGDRVAKKIINFRLNNKFFDSLNDKAFRNYKKFKGNKDDFLLIQYRKAIYRLNVYQKNIALKNIHFLENFSIIRLWNASILMAVVVGMISMSFVYRYLGQGVSAKNSSSTKENPAISLEVEKEKKWTKEKEDEYIAELADYLEIEASKDFNAKAKELVEGYPIEDMLPYIINKDPEVASFLIAIAKKESNWGKRVPVLNGKDCYNYWGYRGKSAKMGTGGHTCFANRKEAVNVVAKRIEELIKKYDRDTAKEMVVWKCGSDCGATGGHAAANKWINDVDMYLKKLNQDN